MAIELYNDVAFTGTYIFYSVIGLLILGLSIFVHEFGHMFYFKVYLKKKIKIRFQYKNIFNFRWLAGSQEDYDHLSTKDYVRVNFFGVMMGMIPIIAAWVYHPIFSMLIIPYLVGCGSDLREIMKNTKWEGDE